LVLANTEGAVGLKSDQAELHPFFQLPADAQVGDIAFLALQKEEWQPRSLVSLPTGTLCWLSGTAGPVYRCSATGSQGQNWGSGDDTGILGLQLDSRDRLWRFGDTSYGFSEMVYPDGTDPVLSPDFHCLPAAFTAPPMNLAAGADGALWVSLPGQTFRCSAVDGFITGTFGTGNPGHSTNILVPDRDGKVLFLVGPDRDDILVCPPGEKAFSVPLQAGLRIQRMAKGADPRMWFTATGPGLSAIGVFDHKRGASLVLLGIPFGDTRGEKKDQVEV
jgi:hypothetical protein